MDTDERVLSGLDVDRPNAARIYDYYLGGAHNFAVDRRVAEQAIVVHPDIPLMAHANRAFLRRVVLWLVAAGVRQFLDIGSGIPTVGHVHEIAQSVAPASRVVYVDIDSVAVAYTRHILGGNGRAAVVQEDFRRPEDILDAPEVRRLLDLTQPVAVLVLALLHHLPDVEDPAALISRLTAPLVPGSYLAISHGTEDGRRDGATVGKEIYRRSGLNIMPRSRAQVEALFNGWELVEPGVVWVTQWHPEWPDDPRRQPEDSSFYGGVARKS
jgi:SAM-dependent methyltransferase